MAINVDINCKNTRRKSKSLNLIFSYLNSAINKILNYNFNVN